MNRHSKEGKLFVISGPSGAGKGTICRRLQSECDIDLSISMTTREPREGERDGIDYYFVTKDEFMNNIGAGNLLEYAEVYGNMYGTPKDAVMKQLAKGRDVILEIDIQGGLQVRKTMPKSSVLIFILPPDLQTLRSRINARGTDSQEDAEKRFGEALNEIKLMGEYDYYVVNDKLDDAVGDVKTIIAAEDLKMPDKIMPIVRQFEKDKK
jgi:guanylate kinase